MQRLETPSTPFLWQDVIEIDGTMPAKHRSQLHQALSVWATTEIGQQQLGEIKRAINQMPAGHTWLQAEVPKRTRLFDGFARWVAPTFYEQLNDINERRTSPKKLLLTSQKITDHSGFYVSSGIVDEPSYLPKSHILWINPGDIDSIRLPEENTKTGVRALRPTTIPIIITHEMQHVVDNLRSRFERASPHYDRACLEERAVAAENKARAALAPETHRYRYTDLHHPDTFEGTDRLAMKALALLSPEILKKSLVLMIRDDAGCGGISEDAINKRLEDILHTQGLKPTAPDSSEIKSIQPPRPNDTSFMR